MTRRTVRTAATCSALALATALAAAPAAAQSFQGNSTVVFGSATVTTAPNTTDVQVDSASAVIDWSPNDTSVVNGAPILFQPAGTTATFHNNSSTMNDFAVLNRIVPVDATRPIIFDGTVISRLQTSAGQVPGGTVFFYSPGGIIVGANAVFDVGNLGLTSAPPAVDGNGNWYTGNQVQFGQAAAGTSVRIDAGAQINALAEGSYVAAFAPQVVQSGTINVNGQAALVAAEAGTITFSPDGLFNIQVSIGTDETFAIDHSGTTTGPASSGTGDNHRIYMVAIPKNTAVQLAIGRGSTIGFDVAGAADTVGNAVILSAGRNVSGGVIGGVAGGPAGASIDINDSSSASSAPGIDFTSAVTGSATNNVFVNVFNQTNFASDASFQADENAQLSVGAIPDEAPGALTVGGNLTLSTNRFFPVSTAPGDAGSTFLFASDGGTIDVAGDLTLTAHAIFDTDGDGVVTGGLSQLLLDSGAMLNVGGDMLIQAGAFTDMTGGLEAFGGTAQAYLFGESALDVAGVTRIMSYGLAGLNNGFTGSGADGTGGFSLLFVTEGSSATFNELNIAADGVGGFDTGSGAGDGFGGTAQINVQGAGSTLTVQQANITGDLNFGELELVSAEGIGGATGISGSTAGTGTGGSAGLFGSDGGTINLPTDPLGPATVLTGRGFGGAATAGGTTGGNAFGGTVSLFLDNSTLFGENLVVSSFAQGGNATTGATGAIDGGDGTGGTRSISLVNGAVFTGSVTGGGPSGVGGDGSATGTGGDGTGGQAFLNVDNSTLNVTAGGFISFNQTAGGGGAVGGNASGGGSFAQIVNGGVVNLAAGANFGISANAFGGGYLTAVTDVAGDGAAGSASLVITSGGSITGSGSVEVVALGFGGVDAVQGGDGTGGSAFVDIVDGTVTVDQIAVASDGFGGSYLSTGAPVAGVVSGNGTGGTAGVNLTGATVTANSIAISAIGEGGFIDAAGFTGLTGGAGTGGTAFIQALGGTNAVTATDLNLVSEGFGATISAGSGEAGIGSGGQAYLRSAATLNVTASVALDANGDGGSAVDGGTGGTGISGVADVTAAGGATLTLQGSLAVDASSTGGSGTVGGAATFGSTPNQVVLNADNGTLTLNGPVLLTANALGGSGTTGNGGAATAGNIFAVAQNGGLITLMAETEAFTFATGGATVDGMGGAATGGVITYVGRDGGTLRLDNPNATLTADSQATGGSASGLGDGGDATAGFTTVRGNGGTVTITGNLNLISDATGGNGVNGGDANGSTNSFVQVNTFLHAINGGLVDVLGTTNMTSFIAGGFGANGGAGGDAIGGAVLILAQTNTASSLASRINLHDVFAFNETVGGDGGLSATGAGGAGGDATAGSVEVLGSAGSGQLTIDGNSTFESIGTGGAGGDGATGGVGGNAVGGLVLFGARSGVASADNSGSADFNGDVFATGVGIGGDGGVGSTGAGGDGGDGANGNVILLVRGSPVTVTGTAQLLAYGFGGNGGTGATGDGAGGDGIAGGSGGIAVEATDRFESPGNRGTLTAATITGQALAVGGTGSTPGAGLIDNRAASVLFRGAEGDIGSLNFAVSGDAVIATDPDLISLTDATVNVGGFTFFTRNDLILALDGAVLNVNDLSLQARSLVLPPTAPTAPGTINVANNLQLFVESGGSLRTFANFNTDFGVSFTVDGDFQTGDFTANGDIFIQSLNGTVTTGDLSGGAISLFAAQDITAGDIDANGDIILRSQSGTVNVGALSGASLDLSSAQSIVLGDFTATGAISLESLNGSVTAGNLTSGGSLDISAGLNVTTGNLQSGAALNVNAGGNASLGAITAVGDAFLNLEGALAVGNVQTGGRFSTLAQGDQAIGNVVAGNAVDIRGSSDIVTGAITSPASVYVLADGGNLTTGDISAGDPALTDGRRFGIGLRGDSVSTGDLATPGAIIAAAVSGSVAIGDVNSDQSVLLFAAQNVSGGSVSAGTDPGETLYVGSTSDLSRLGQDDDFSQVIAVSPAPVGGSVTFGGPISADTVLAASAGAFSAGQITASSFIEISTGGLLTVNGPWQAPSLSVTANDIAIAQAGRLRATNGEVEIISTNSNGSFIGNGSAQSGRFVLDNAEFGRISGGGITIGQLDTEGLIDMTFGDLTIDGSQLSAGEGESDGFIDFYVDDTLDRDGEAGGMRINGNVAASGFTDEMQLDFNASLFELNAATGSITIAGSSSGSLGGTLEIEADRIHVASEEILLRLREDPFYEGRVNDLNRPGDVDRPEGVLRARGIEFFPTETLYIQNTGSATNPAGFFTTIENSDIEPPGFEDPEAPDVEVIINGRFQGENGEVSGSDAFDLIANNAESLAGFTETSQVNGCAFATAVCTVAIIDEEAPPPVSAAEIEVLTEDQAEEEPFDTEDEEEAEDEASSPIAPPVVLINTRPLSPEIDIDDPVSGTGNPALIDSSLNDAPQGDDQ